MKESRRPILEAKRHLYALIINLKYGEMTNDDLNIGVALMQDTEIKRLLDEEKWSKVESS